MTILTDHPISQTGHMTSLKSYQIEGIPPRSNRVVVNNLKSCMLINYN